MAPALRSDMQLNLRPGFRSRIAEGQNIRIIIPNAPADRRKRKLFRNGRGNGRRIWLGRFLRELHVRKSQSEPILVAEGLGLPVRGQRRIIINDFVESAPGSLHEGKQDEHIANIRIPPHGRDVRQNVVLGGLAQRKGPWRSDLKAIKEQIDIDLGSFYIVIPMGQSIHKGLLQRALCIRKGRNLPGRDFHEPRLGVPANESKRILIGLHEIALILFVVCNLVFPFGVPIPESAMNQSVLG